MSYHTLGSAPVGKAPPPAATPSPTDSVIKGRQPDPLPPPERIPPPPPLRNPDASPLERLLNIDSIDVTQDQIKTGRLAALACLGAGVVLGGWAGGTQRRGLGAGLGVVAGAALAYHQNLIRLGIRI